MWFSIEEDKILFKVAKHYFWKEEEWKIKKDIKDVVLYFSLTQINIENDLSIV